MAANRLVDVLVVPSKVSLQKDRRGSGERECAGAAVHSAALPSGSAQTGTTLKSSVDWSSADPTKVVARLPDFDFHDDFKVMKLKEEWPKGSGTSTVQGDKCG